MKTTSIKQGVMLPGTSHQVFELLMDSKQHAACTGGEARISPKVGGKFSVFDGWATGQNIELVQDKKIVQEWRANEWPEGHYSVVSFTLLPAQGGTKLLFTQQNVPSTFAKDIAAGWKTYYWSALKEYLRTKK